MIFLMKQLFMIKSVKIGHNTEMISLMKQLFMIKSVKIGHNTEMISLMKKLKKLSLCPSVCGNCKKKSTFSIFQFC